MKLKRSEMRSLTAAGAESVDAAREQHWIGLRGADRSTTESSAAISEADENRIPARLNSTISGPNGEDFHSEPEIGSAYAYRCGYERLDWPTVTGQQG